MLMPAKADPESVDDKSRAIVRGLLDSELPLHQADGNLWVTERGNSTGSQVRHF
jgi:hypothetical protein